VQAALDRFERDREIEISVQSVRYRSAFIGGVLRELPGAEVVRSASPPRIRLVDRAPTTTGSRPAVGMLLGCVKIKCEQRGPAKDLYRSPLWAGRRAHAEASGYPWLILSAAHGLVEPDVELDPYDLALGDLTALERRGWGEDVVSALERQFGTLDGMMFEVHAGAPYRDAIAPGFAIRGASLEVPLDGLALGSQLAWYHAHRQPATTPLVARWPTATPADVRAALRALDTAPSCVPACDWPAAAPRIDRPGLYAWWVNAVGAAYLSEGLGQAIAAGRIYAGQAGATKWPSGKAGDATLASRIGSQHLRGRIRASTFRLTLAACLRRPLGLKRLDPLRLETESEEALSFWIAEHLAVAVHPVDDRDPLSDLEHLVLAQLDPPLNLEGMQTTDTRAALSKLRSGLAN